MAALPERPAARSGRTFDTLAYAKRMESVGFTRQQAEVLAEEQAKLIDDRLATKDDIESLRLASQTDIASVQAGLRELELKLHNRIDEMELRLTSQQKEALLRTGGMIVAGVGILLAFKYFG